MLPRWIKIIIVVFLNCFAFLYAQDLRGNLSNAKVEKGVNYCKELNLRKVNNPKTFLYCQTVYVEKNQIRDALNVIEIANKKFPYSYDIRLEKSLILQEIGNHEEASKEIIGLLKLYPRKFDLHNYLARMQFNQNRIKSVMPFMVSLIVDPKHPLSGENLLFVKHLLNNKSFPQEVKTDVHEHILSTGENNFDFSIFELQHKSDGMQHKSDKAYLMGRLNIFLKSLEHTKCQKSGFFWNYYAAYFEEVNENQLLTEFVDVIVDKTEPSQRLRKINVKYGLQ